MNRFATLFLAAVMASSAWAVSATACDKTSCEFKSGVYFKGLHDNTAIDQEFTVQMVVNGMNVQQAGELVEGTGHFHILIDDAAVEQGEPVKKDATHLHFGKGQSEATLKLTPGEHTLTLQFADGHHVSYGKLWSRTVPVYVKP
ncbi:MAG: hypothetical protein AUJ56_03925 [Zetaproteobacteria bacterium CG1_02_49_23]|nr:MAG: hypothetical protein AUJ56_03925 [Zetaproteobacteria bacterium CG1_02_49_23]